jgi:adenosine deaminase CECR1
MPKGGLLHAHFDATVDIRELMTIARGQSNIYIRITKPFPPDIAAIASANSLDLPLANFTTLRTDKADNTMAVSLTSPDYALGTWIQMNTARESFPKELGGVLGFDDWLYRSLTIDPVEAYETHSSVSRVGLVPAVAPHI